MLIKGNTKEGLKNQKGDRQQTDQWLPMIGKWQRMTANRYRNFSEVMNTLKLEYGCTTLSIH